MGLEDKTLTCRDCGASFLFSAAEQRFYASKGLLHEPARCPACRAARRGRLAAKGDGSEQRRMYTATCAACGKPAHLPFVPTGDRPVYCSECYERLRSQRA